VIQASRRAINNEFAIKRCGHQALHDAVPVLVPCANLVAAEGIQSERDDP
jgi:hypothetical protein